MASFNKVILLGNLTRDVEMRYLQNGTGVAELGLAVNRMWFDKASNQKKEEVTFVDVTVWGRTAEVAAEYLSKGRSVLIEGYLKLDQWDDKESGQRRSKLRVVCDSLTMVGNKLDGGERPQQPRQQQDKPSPQRAADEPIPTAFDDEVPF